MEDKLTPTAPTRIWLQVDTNDDDRSLPFPEDAEGVSWWKEMVGGAEVEYVRADLVRSDWTTAGTDCVTDLRAIVIYPDHTLDSGSGAYIRMHPLALRSLLNRAAREIEQLRANVAAMSQPQPHNAGGKPASEARSA